MFDAGSLAAEVLQRWAVRDSRFSHSWPARPFAWANFSPQKKAAQRLQIAMTLRDKSASQDREHVQDFSDKGLQSTAVLPLNDAAPRDDLNDAPFASEGKTVARKAEQQSNASGTRAILSASAKNTPSHLGQIEASSRSLDTSHLRIPNKPAPDSSIVASSLSSEGYSAREQRQTTVELLQTRPHTSAGSPARVREEKTVVRRAEQQNNASGTRAILSASAKNAPSHLGQIDASSRSLDTAQLRIQKKPVSSPPTAPSSLPNGGRTIQTRKQVAGNFNAEAPIALPTVGSSLPREGHPVREQVATDFITAAPAALPIVKADPARQTASKFESQAILSPIRTPFTGLVQKKARINEARLNHGSSAFQDAVLPAAKVYGTNRAPSNLGASTAETNENTSTALPLARVSYGMNQAWIARQAEERSDGGAQGRSSTPAAPATTTMAEASAQPPAQVVDTGKIAETVYRMLYHKLAVERERRGLGRWY